MSGDRLPTIRRWAGALDPVGLAILPVAMVALGAMYAAVGDALSFFGEPGDPSAGRRAVAAGSVLVATAFVYARRRHPFLAIAFGASGVVPPVFLLALPDTAYDLLAIWMLGPPAVLCAVAACVRRRRPRAATTASATMAVTPQER
jgi:hypothetical protein